MLGLVVPKLVGGPRNSMPIVLMKDRGYQEKPLQSSRPDLQFEILTTQSPAISVPTGYGHSSHDH